MAWNPLFRNNRLRLYLKAAATLALAAAFVLPTRAERRSKTAYKPMAGAAAYFTVNASSAAGPADRHQGRAVERAIRLKFSPYQANALLQAIEAMGHAPTKTSPRPAWRGHAKKEALKTPAPPQVSYKNPMDAPPQEIDGPELSTLEKVQDWFEPQGHKFILDQTASLRGITLRLVALCWMPRKFVVKVSVVNESQEDFFIKNIMAKENSRETGEYFIRLFVESGKTIDGYMVFNRPLSGGKVDVVLKEDRAAGRVLSAPLEYPF